MSEQERLQMLREGKTLTSSFLVKQLVNANRKDGVYFARVLNSNRIDYVFIEKPKFL